MELDLLGISEQFLYHLTWQLRINLALEIEDPDLLAPALDCRQEFNENFVSIILRMKFRSYKLRDNLVDYEL